MTITAWDNNDIPDWVDFKDGREQTKKGSMHQQWSNSSVSPSSPAFDCFISSCCYHLQFCLWRYWWLQHFNHFHQQCSILSSLACCWWWKKGKQWMTISFQKYQRLIKLHSKATLRDSTCRDRWYEFGQSFQTTLAWCKVAIKAKLVWRLLTHSYTTVKQKIDVWLNGESFWMHQKWCM